MTLPLQLIDCQVTIPAEIGKAWEAWTTEAGLVSFLAPTVRVVPESGGAFEIYFNPDGPAGSRGAEGMRFLALQEPVFLSFTWNAPPHLPTVRGQHTHVDLFLSETSPGQTTVRLVHGGWGSGGEWDQAYTYFSRAWAKVVLPRLRHRFEHGPVDWKNPPVFDQ